MTCPAVRPGGLVAAFGGPPSPCILDAGHAGPHRDAQGEEWPRRLVSAADEYRAACRIQSKAIRSLAEQVRAGIDELGVIKLLPNEARDQREATLASGLAKLAGVERALLAIARHLETAGAE